MQFFFSVNFLPADYVSTSSSYIIQTSVPLPACVSKLKMLFQRRNEGIIQFKKGCVYPGFVRTEWDSQITYITSTAFLVLSYYIYLYLDFQLGINSCTLIIVSPCQVKCVRIRTVAITYRQCYCPI
jgi:hypothetical protein